jgi:1,4-dihydroxy-6-naphthoate synthase
MRSPDHLGFEGTELSISYSPCPNDTFSMDALVHGRIALSGIRLRPFLMDIQQLNLAANEGKYDITKISAAHWAAVEDRYDLLDAGAALGFGVGPIIVSNQPENLSEIGNLRVAIPGANTTANRLFHHFYQAGQVLYMPFDQIETALLDGTADAGVLIHEGRFTYQQKGLFLWADLGALWEEKYKLPIPLGVWIIRNSFHSELKRLINLFIRSSIEFAFQYPAISQAYIQSHAQEMSPTIQSQHIALYVNEYSLSMGEQGLQALRFLGSTQRKMQVSE